MAKIHLPLEVFLFTGNNIFKKKISNIWADEKTAAIKATGLFKYLI
ncbi:hypothetical protein HMPREF1557_01486 [Streptococcus sobrinus W1703]|uniref:Uncharacterized protein n=1 Tax=Streptococcus sobrinus W1703 TaxID=1227275 RepID=U2J3S7_9STRE|nr:hypothetical protein HMPREF1557_01486 [Streptococcus sobrinus W1703]